MPGKVVAFGALGKWRGKDRGHRDSHEPSQPGGPSGLPAAAVSDETLAARIADGDENAFAELVRRYTGKLGAFAYRNLFNRTDAEDVVQDTFLKLWQNPQLWDPGRGAKFSSWVYRVVMNACHDRNRGLKPSLELVEDILPANAPEQDRQMIAAERTQTVEGMISRLPDRQRQALLLCFYEELSRAEAARIMGIGVKALESLLSRAKAALKVDMALQEDLR